MKELLKSLYIFGIERRDNYYPILEDEAFDVWYEQNKSKIDDVVDSYLESQGKTIIDTEERYNNLVRRSFLHIDEITFDESEGEEFDYHDLH